MTGSVRSVLLIALLPAVAAAYLGWQRVSRPASDVLAAMPRQVEIDVGTIDQFSPQPLTAVVENPTGAAVTIAAARSSCGCAPVEDDVVGAVVPPGGSREFTAVYDAALPGEFAKSIDVMLEVDGGEPVPRTFRFRGNVRQQIEVLPAPLFGRPGESPVLDVRLAFGGPLVVSAVDLPCRRPSVSNRASRRDDRH